MADELVERMKIGVDDSEFNSKHASISRKLGTLYDEGQKSAKRMANAGRDLEFSIKRQMAAGDQLQRKIVDLDQAYANLDAEMRSIISNGGQVSDSMIKQAASIRKTSEALREQKKRADESNQMFERFRATGIASAAFGMALVEIQRALKLVAENFSASVKPLEQVRGQWTLLDKSLASIKQTIDDPKFQDLGWFDKIVMVHYRALDTTLAEVSARHALLTEQIEARKVAYKRLGEEASAEAAKEAAFFEQQKKIRERLIDIQNTGRRGPRKIKEYTPESGSSEEEINAFNFNTELDARRQALQAHQKWVHDFTIDIEKKTSERILDINLEEYRMLDAARKRDVELSKKASASKISFEKEAGAVMASVTNIAGGAFTSFLDDVINGSDDAGTAFAVAMLKGVGQMMIGKGTAHIAEAAAIAFIPGLQGNAGGLAAAGAAEVALGTSLYAGGAVAASATGVGGGGGAGSGPRGGADFGPGTVNGHRFGTSAYATPSGPQPVTIVIQGSIYDGAAAGVAINKALGEARRQGVLKG